MVALTLLELILGIVIGILVSQFVVAKHGYYIMDAKNKIVAIVFGNRNARLVESAADMYDIMLDICKDGECDGKCNDCALVNIYEYIEHNSTNSISFNCNKEKLKDILKRGDK